MPAQIALARLMEQKRPGFFQSSARHTWINLREKVRERFREVHSLLGVSENRISDHNRRKTQ
jgi:hypothetical protein